MRCVQFYWRTFLKTKRHLQSNTLFGENSRSGVSFALSCSGGQILAQKFAKFDRVM